MTELDHTEQCLEKGARHARIEKQRLQKNTYRDKPGQDKDLDIHKHTSTAASFDVQTQTMFSVVGWNLGMHDES